MAHCSSIWCVGKGTDAACKEALTVSPLIASAAVALRQRHCASHTTDYMCRANKPIDYIDRKKMKILELQKKKKKKIMYIVIFQ